jgi:hypothetical protein
VVNKDGVLKFGGRLEGDDVKHFWGWIKRPITRNLVWKCSYVNDIIERGLMMWTSCAMDGNKQDGKWLIVECKALKWVKSNNAPP